MPKCKKCLKNFPGVAFIKGKNRYLRHRKYCLECSPFGKHNTKKLHMESSPQDSEKVCTMCGRVYTYMRGKGHTKSRCNSCMANAQRVRLKERIIKYLGGKCLLCGYSKCMGALECHHKDSAEKEFNVSGSHCLRWDKIVKELDKCVLLCSNCHRELESKNTPVPQMVRGFAL